MQKPWVLLLSSGANETIVNASTETFGSVAYRTTDKDVQEDAFRITLTDAKSLSGVKIASKSFFREDMSNEFINNSALSFMVKPDTELTQAVVLNMSCESEGDTPGSCRGSLDITDKLKALPVGEWSEMTIDLRCYAQQGIDFSKLVVPFHLLSTGNTSLEISAIEFKFDAADEADVKCD